MKRGDAEYLEFPTYFSGLIPEDKDRLASMRLVFCYPVLSENEFELVEQPVSQRQLMAVFRASGCQIIGEVVPVSGDDLAFPDHAGQGITHVIIHPMISTLHALSGIISGCRARYASAEIIIQNSDQHQHEKVIGGPESGAIAAHFLEREPDLDWVIHGFAEHALMSLLLERPTRVVTGRGGPGTEVEKFFTMQSLPLVELPHGQTFEDGAGSIRIQRSRGCLSGCTYCIEGQANRSTTSERPWVGLSMEAFVDRLSLLCDKGYFFINLIDSSFEDPGRRGVEDLRRFCHLIVDRGLTFSFKMHMRAENVLKLSTDDLNAMKQAGVDVIVIGLESGSPHELAFFKKIATREINIEAARHLESQQMFCNIFGYMMFSPVVSIPDVVEKVHFLRHINRAWDFLNLTNRVLVFWGSAMHRDLEAMGLINVADVTPGYVAYSFQHAETADLDARTNALKQRRPEFLLLNKLIYDAMNIESRLQNPMNASYLKIAGTAFRDFQSRLRAHQVKLNDTYSAAFEQFATARGVEFLPDFDVAEVADAQRSEIRELLNVFSEKGEIPKTLFLETWLSVVNHFGVKNAA